MTIYHTHHIIPKHMGGTNESSNLIRLTIEDHAKAHYDLYQKYGRWQDLVAWLSLSKQISITEARIMAVKFALTGKSKSPEQKKKMSESHRKRLGPKKIKQPKSKHIKIITDQFRLTMRNLKLNTIWITNGDINKQLAIESDIPVGWKRGRTLHKKYITKNRISS